MRKLSVAIILTSLAISFCSCCNTRRTVVVDNLDTIFTPKYAKGFEIYKCGKSSIISIHNPWQGAAGVNHTVFVSRNNEVPAGNFNGVILRTPVKRVACMSSSHVAFIDALGHLDAVKAVSGVRYISNRVIRDQAEAGKVKDVGYEGNINYEQLVLMRPDVIFMYSIAGERLPVIDKMKELRIPVVVIGEYLESSPLGKAEWLMVFGEIFDCREQAEIAFRDISNDYNLAKRLARNVSHRPKVMLNAPWKDSWFVPGDRSFMVQLLRDAGAEYACEGVDSEQSRIINEETAYIYASNADYWLNPNAAESVDELVLLNPKFAKIPAVVNSKIYNNTLRSTSEGGSDFWESGTVYPNIVLQDMIQIFHPDLLPDHDPHFFKHLQ